MTSFTRTIATTFTALTLAGCAAGPGGGRDTFFKSPENASRRNDGLNCIDKAKVGEKTGAEAAAIIDACNGFVNNHLTKPYGTTTTVNNNSNTPYFYQGAPGYGTYAGAGTGYAVPPPGAVAPPAVAPAPAPAATPAPPAPPASIPPAPGAY